MGKTKASLSPIHRSSPCFLRNRTPVCGTVVTEDMAESWPTGGTLQMLIHLGGAWTRVPIPATYKQSGAADPLLLTVPLNNASYKPAPQEKLKKKIKAVPPSMPGTDKYQIKASWADKTLTTSSLSSSRIWEMANDGNEGNQNFIREWRENEPKLNNTHPEMLGRGGVGFGRNILDKHRRYCWTEQEKSCHFLKHLQH